MAKDQRKKTRSQKLASRKPESKTGIIDILKEQGADNSVAAKAQDVAGILYNNSPIEPSEILIYIPKEGFWKGRRQTKLQYALRTLEEADLSEFELGKVQLSEEGRRAYERD